MREPRVSEVPDHVVVMQERGGHGGLEEDWSALIYRVR